MNDFREFSIRYKKYLMHHGIKGQQWGVRNGPPYPIENKVLKKGTRLQTVSRAYTANNGELLRKFLKKK